MIRTLRHSLFAFALALGTVAAFTPVTDAVAAPTSGEATKFLQGKQAAVNTLLSAPAKTPADVKKRDEKVDAELATMVDYDQMAQDALGIHWKDRSDGEKKEFTDLLKQLIQKNYKKKLTDTLNYAIDYKGETPKGTDVIVHTEAQNKNDKRDPAVLIDYVLRKNKDGKYIVVDLVPEGSPMIKTYNKEFKKIIDKDGFPAVITKMKEKLAKT